MWLSAKQVAQKAFSELSVGTHDLDTHRIVHTGKYVIVMPKLEHWPEKYVPGAEVHVLAYPAPSDLQSFETVANSMDLHSPGKMYPGAVGMVKLRSTVNGLLVEYAQSTFHTGDKYKVNLPRKLATKYGGWKKRSLDAIREAVRIKKIELIE